MINNIINFLIEPRPEKPLYLIRNLISIRAIRPGIGEHGYDPDFYEVIMNRAAMPGSTPQACAVLAEAPYPDTSLLSAYQKLIRRRPPESRDDLAIYHLPQDVILLEVLSHGGDVIRDIYQEPTSRLKKSDIPAALAVIMPFILLFQRSTMAGLALCQPISMG